MCFYCTTKTWPESRQILSLLTPYLQNLLHVFDPRSLSTYLTACNPGLPGRVVFTHHRNNGAICLSSRPGHRADGTLAHWLQWWHLFQDVRLLESYNKIQDHFSNLIFLSLNSCKPSQAIDYRMKRRKTKIYQNTHTGIVYTHADKLLNNCKIIHGKDLQKCGIRKSKMPRMLHQEHL